MPVVSVGRDKLFDALGKTYSKCDAAALSLTAQTHNSRCTTRVIIVLLCSGQEEFEILCFDYGIELDDVVSCRAASKSDR